MSARKITPTTPPKLSKSIWHLHGVVIQSLITGYRVQVARFLDSVEMFN